MYCPVCGAESTQGLNYCKRCGASLGTTVPIQTPSGLPRAARNVGIVWALVIAIIAVCAGGLGISFGIGGGLMASGVRGEDGPIGIVLGGALVVLVVAVMLIRLLSRVIGMSAPTTVRPAMSQSMREPVAQLPAPPPSVSSVTEHTTRTFDHAAYREPTARE